MPVGQAEFLKSLEPLIGRRVFDEDIEIAEKRMPDGSRVRASTFLGNFRGQTLTAKKAEGIAREMSWEEGQDTSK
ncbi:MAG: hypothetical protein ABIB97_01630 [Patescibacteria group bacterium]